MTKQQFHKEMEDILELPPGSVTGSESLSDLEQWDSLAALTFISMADANFKVVIPASDLTKCQTVADLMNLFPGQIS